MEVEKETEKDYLIQKKIMFKIYLRCILTIAWNCSGSVSVILFPTSMAPTMVSQIFPTSENNIGVIVLAQSSYKKRIGYFM